MAEELADAMFGGDVADAMFGDKQPKEDMGWLNAAATSLAKGANQNWGDEFAGWNAAGTAGLLPEGVGRAAGSVSAVPALIGLARLGYETLMGPGSATEAYGKAKKEAQEKEKLAAEQYPKTALASEITGALLTPSPFVGSAKTVGELAAAGAKVGAASGILSGAGEGEGLIDRAAKATTSGILGAGAGAIAAPLIGKTAQGIGNLLGRGAREVAEEVPGQVAKAVPDDAVGKITEALKQAKPLERSQAAIYHDIRSGQAGNLARIGREVPGERGFYAQLGALKGELPRVDFESIRPALTQEHIDDLFGQVEQSVLRPFDKIHAKTALSKLLGAEGGAVPTKSEIAILEQVFPSDFIQAALDKQPFLRQAMDHIGEAINIPRAIRASTDLSAPLRQGLFMVTRPKQFVPAFKDMFKYAFDERAYRGLMDDLQKRPTFDLMRKAGLALQDIDHPLLSHREEAFITNLPDKVPFFGKVYRGSNRAYTGFLTKLRADVFDDLYGRAERLGVADRPGLAEDLAEFVNTFTGRGAMTWRRAGEAEWSKEVLEKAGPILNGVFFSPRLMASRLQILNPQFYYKMDPFVRKEALKSLITTSGGVMTALGLAKMAGADIELDPRNADFAKIKTGNTRYEISGGITPYLRLGAQLAPEWMGGGKVISSTSGRTMTLGEGYKPMTRWDIFMRFLESKEAPIFGLAHKMMKGQGFIGRELNPRAEAIDMFTPLMIGDLWDVYQEYGAAGMPMAAPGVFGVGAQTYGKVQFEEGKNKAGLPAAQIGPPPEWGEYVAEHPSRPWEAAFGKEGNTKGSSRRFDIETFMRDNYAKMSPDDRREFAQALDRYPTLRRSVLKVKNEIDSGITARELDLKAKTVGDGTRALAIKAELEGLKTYSEKRSLWDRYRTLGVITDDVQQQLEALKAIPRIDPTNTIPKKDQKEIDKAISLIGRQSGGRVRVGTSSHFYTEDELEASRREDQRFREFMGRVAPRGIPWESWRRSTNIEDRSDEQQVPYQTRLQRRYAPARSFPPVTDLSIQAGYDDLTRARGGKIRRRIPSNVTIPESPAILRRQQQALIAGNRKAMLYPHPSMELALPRGMRRMKTKDGILHFSPKMLTPSQIKKASEKGKINEILELGPVTKEEALDRVAKGEKPLAVTERSPDGVEAKAALGTDRTAPEQVAALEASAAPENAVGIEEVPETLLKRIVDNPVYAG